tara:strand:+ start:252 stop:965 length:714 start_codon:yes stop_codon:yes gene_type:complete
MTQSSVGVPIAFGIMLFLLLWLIIYTEGKWFLKLAAVAATLFFSVSLWHSVDSMLGLPSETQLPEKFLVHWIVVEEPNKVTGDEGSIYIWAKNITPPPKEAVATKAKSPLNASKTELVGAESECEDCDSKPTDYALELQEVDLETPRVHTVPYSRKLHQQCNRALQMLKDGKPVYGNGKDFANARKGKGNGKGKGKGKSKGKGDRQGEQGRQGNPGQSSVQQDSIFHELPPPKMPDK